MADELDPRLEARLRTALRAEADSLPFTIRAEQVAGRLAERRRASDRRRYAAVAAAVVVAVGAAAFGLSQSRIPGPAATSPSPVAPTSTPAPSSTSSLAADCVPADDPATLPGLDIVDGTGALITQGEVVYDRRSDGAATGDPDGWVVPADAATASLESVLLVDAGDACVAEWSIQVAQTADVVSAIDAGVAPQAEDYVVSAAPDGGHDVMLNELPSGDVLVRVAATWYSTQPNAPVTVRIYRLSHDQTPVEPTATVPADAEPSLPEPLPGESTLFELPVEGGAAPDELSAEIPAGTDAFFVTLDCSGSGTVTLDIDGVVWSFPCEGTSVTQAARGADDLLEVTASAEGALRALVRLGAFDMKRNPDATFVPPALTLTGPDATSGDQASVRGFLGCGLSYQPRGGSGGFADECGRRGSPSRPRSRSGPAPRSRSRSEAAGTSWTSPQTLPPTRTSCRRGIRPRRPSRSAARARRSTSRRPGTGASAS